MYANQLLDDEVISSMFNLETRLKSFKNTFVLEGKKYRWRYTVIPYEAMARAGFFYYPIRHKDSGELHKDAVGCIFCKTCTYNFGDCRSKRKDTVETMISVIQQHLTTGCATCLLSRLKLFTLTDFAEEKPPREGENCDFFKDPLSEIMIDLRKFTFMGNWPYSTGTLSPDNMAKAGLIRYDSSYTGFEEVVESNVRDASLCIFCKKVINSWQVDDDPLWEHYKSCNGGQCYFFQMLQDSPAYNEILDNLRIRYAALETNKLSPPKACSSSTEQTPMDFKSTLGIASTLGEREETNTELDIVKTGNDMEASKSTAASPKRKKRKLKASHTETFSERNNEEELDDNHANEELVIKFKEHIERAKDVGRKNKILDDSKDEFSFSIDGHSTFEIPTASAGFRARAHQGSKTVLENIEDHSISDSQSNNALAGQRAFELNGSLDILPMDVSLSSNTSSLDTGESTPIHSPKSGIKEGSPPTTHNLRHIRKFKVC